MYQQKEGRSWTGSKSSMTLHTFLCYGDAAAVMVTDWATELLNDPTVYLCACVCVCLLQVLFAGCDIYRHLYCYIVVLVLYINF